jgi:Cft2 family RNA processing exonuclease
MSTLQELGFTKEDIETKLIEKIASDLMNEYVYETDTGASYPDNSRLARRFIEVIRKHVDAQMERLAQEFIVPRVAELIQEVAIRHTNAHGEDIRNPETFTEYLARMAENYLSQPVNYDGNPIEHNRYSKNEQTRLIHLVNKHLHSSVESAMKNAVDIVKQQLGASLEQTVKIKLADLAKSITVSVSK